MLGNFPPYPGIIVDMHMIQRGLCINSQFPLCPNNLSRVFLARSHHPRSVEVCDLAVIELDQTNSIVAIVVFAKVWFDRCNANCGDRFDFAILSKEPESQIDIVNRAVDEDPAGELRVSNEEAGRVELVAGLAAHDGGRTNGADLHFVVGVSVGGVEAAGEAAHYFEMGFLRGCVDNCLGLQMVSFEVIAV